MKTTPYCENNIPDYSLTRRFSGHVFKILVQNVWRSE